MNNFMNLRVELLNALNDHKDVTNIVAQLKENFFEACVARAITPSIFRYHAQELAKHGIYYNISASEGCVVLDAERDSEGLSLVISGNAKAALFGKASARLKDNVQAVLFDEAVVEATCDSVIAYDMAAAKVYANTKLTTYSEGKNIVFENATETRYVTKERPSRCCC